MAKNDHDPNSPVFGLGALHIMVTQDVVFSYASAVLGGENIAFLADVFRFRGDFTDPLSARRYLEFLDQERNVCCTTSYPVGGMSEFICRME